MTYLIEGSEYSDYIVQNRKIKLEVYAYGGNDDIVLNRTDKYGGLNYVDAGSGNDFVKNYFEGGNDIFLGRGNDIYHHTGTAGFGDEYDVVSGGSGNDIFKVKTLHSVYKGDSGNDTFYSVGYENTFKGGRGRDTINYSLQDSTSGERGRGIYVDLDKGFAEALSGREETLESIENVVGTNFRDTLIGTDGSNIIKGRGGNDQLEGLGGNDRLYGGAGKDVIYGDSGNDDLYGDSGNDRLYGGSGKDDLVGGSGNDLLVGGSGKDFLVGGSGADVFRFTKVSDSRTGSQRDVIEDFKPDSQGDVIDLRGIDADVNTSRNDAFDFIGKAAFSGTAGELRYSGTIIAGDVDGDGRGDFHIDAGLVRYFESDFLL
ncbi:calcium-binding protein [Shinella pollutisoli]|uniref:Calcium-binding protein n=1 Tax=Shinella pollutisoli TaxID=2250594 RepID=A0ABV7DDV6_9HYPH|nr:calcium-binding protein [Shinella pollutisoli]